MSGFNDDTPTSDSRRDAVPTSTDNADHESPTDFRTGGEPSERLRLNRRDLLRGTTALGVGAMAPRLAAEPVQAASEATAESPVRFASVPDMFNWDIDNPQPGWEDALDWFFGQLTSEGAEFVLSAGDIMDARWWDSQQQVDTLADQYWVGYKDRFDAHNLPVYVAPGDHERGDNDWPDWKLDLVPAFEQNFVDIFDHPQNGPANKTGLAYYFVQGDVLFVTVDTWELKNGQVHMSVSDDQLTWLEQVLSDHQDKSYIVVQGHVPVLSGVKSRNSSALMLEGGQSSAFWQTMVEYGVDVYLCGEHHDITTKKADGIWQVVHGALWGTHTDLNYLVGTADSRQLRLEIKEFTVEYGGGTIEQMNRNGSGPRETVTVPDSVKQNGPTTVETIVISGCDCAGDESRWQHSSDFVPDQSTHGNDGTINGSVAPVTGKSGAALEFNGGYVSVPESTSIDVSDPPFTVECWVNPADPPSGEEGYEPYVTKVGSDGAQFSLHRTSLDNDAAGQLEFAMKSASGEWITPRGALPNDWQGTWHHLAGVYDGVESKLFIDGVLAGSVPFTGSSTDTSAPIEIGRNNNHTDRKVADGTVIDDVRIHRSALAASELAGGGPDSSTNPVLWYDFDTVESDGLELSASFEQSPYLSAGESKALTVTVTNHADVQVGDVELVAAPPDGWDASATDSTTIGALAPDESVTRQWSVSVPADANTGDYAVVVQAPFTTDTGAACCVSNTVSATVVDWPAPPTSDTYLSDLEAIDYTVGYTFTDFGRDEAVSGNPLMLGDQTFQKGIGTHAPSTIRYHLGGNVARFKATVGIDEKGGEFPTSAGNVVFRVVGDGETLAETDPVTGDASPVPLDVDVTGVTVLELVANENGDQSYDHADWIDARVTTQTVPEAVAGPDGLVTMTELQLAVDWWGTDAVVPGTGGETIGFLEMLQLVNLWATESTVGDGSASTATQVRDPSGPARGRR